LKKIQNNDKMNISVPKVSIGLPVYNGEKYLRFALNSVLEQTYTDFELIISDNASADGTQKICQEFAAKDYRIRYYRNETNIGAAGNYNRVFELGRGEFFKWASHDDEFHPLLLESCLKVFERSPPSTILVFSKAAIIDETGCVTGLSRDTINSSTNRAFVRLGSLIFNAHFAHPLWGLIRSDALRRTRLIGNFEADHILLAELALLGKCIEIPEVFYWERRHAGCATNANRTPQELLAWHNPNRKHRINFLPHGLQRDIEYFKAIGHIPLFKKDRLLCYAAVLVAPVWRWFLRCTGSLRRSMGLSRTQPRPVDKPPAPKHNVEISKMLSSDSSGSKITTH
jgi:glycosyltransferase involved in cell wall biosynthesis